MTGRVVERRETELSEWLTVVEKDVRLGGMAGDVSTFHSLLLKDYVSVLALLPDAHVALVRQFRPAVERDVLEFPGGLVDVGETSLEAAKRELLEECGLSGGDWRYLGKLDPDVGRLENSLHAYTCINPEPESGWLAEADVEAIMMPLESLLEATREGLFSHSQHVAMLGLAFARKIIR